MVFGYGCTLVATRTLLPWESGVTFFDVLCFSRVSQLCCGVTRPIGKLRCAWACLSSMNLNLAVCFVHETATGRAQDAVLVFARTGPRLNGGS